MVACGQLQGLGDVDEGGVEDAVGVGAGVLARVHRLVERRGGGIGEYRVDGIGNAAHDLVEAVGELEQRIGELVPVLRDRHPWGVDGSVRIHDRFSCEGSGHDTKQDSHGRRRRKGIGSTAPGFGRLTQPAVDVGFFGVAPGSPCGIVSGEAASRAATCRVLRHNKRGE